MDATPFLLDGRWVTNPAVAPVRNPHTGEVIAQVCQADRAQLDQAVAAAPSPHFEKVAEASDGLGIRVSHVEDLLPALERGLRAVREEKRQALINVELEISYVKTS